MGLETALRAFLKKPLDWEDEGVAETFEVPLRVVQKVRQSL